MSRRRWVLLGSALMVAVTSIALDGQGRDRRRGHGLPDNVEQTGEFVFTRIRYGSSGGGWGFRSSWWSHDYPRADLHLPQILEHITTTPVHLGDNNVFDLDDPELFEHPIAYISEPGFWTMSEAEAAGLRSYLLKGGFVILDDFEAEQWNNMEAQLRRVLPEHRLIEIDVTHPIYDVFFAIKALDFPHPLVNVQPSYWGLFEDNDPTKRMIAIVNYNNDIAEYWSGPTRGIFRSTTPTTLTSSASTTSSTG